MMYKNLRESSTIIYNLVANKATDFLDAHNLRMHESEAGAFISGIGLSVGYMGIESDIPHTVICGGLVTVYGLAKVASSINRKSGERTIIERLDGSHDIAADGQQEDYDKKFLEMLKVDESDPNKYNDPN